MFVYYISLLTVIVSVTSVFCQVFGQNVCDSSTRKYVINPDASVHIGVIVPVRDPGHRGSGCGNVSRSGIQQVEAMKWIMSVLNQDRGRIGNITVTDSYIPGVKIGMTIEDSCSTEFGALSSAVDINQQFLMTNHTCVTTPSRYDVGMITGTTGNATTLLASLLSDRYMTLISYADANPRLNDVPNYPHLLRTITDYKHIAKTILKVVDILQWEAITVIHSNDSTARDMTSELLKSAIQEGTCIVKVVEVKVGEARVYYEDVITRLLLADVTASVYLGDTEALLGVMDAMPLVRRAGQLQFIASLTAGNRYRLLDKAYSKGLVIVSPASRNLPEFAEYWEAIKPENSVQDNPLFAEWYMTTKQCRLPGNSGANFGPLPACQLPTQKPREESVQDELVEPAITAVYIYAKAMKNAQMDLCQGNPGLCPSLLSLQPGRFFERYLRTLDFTFSKEERIPSLASAESRLYLSSAKRVSFNATGELSGAGSDVWTINDFIGYPQYHKIGTHVGNKLNLIPSDIIFYDITRQDILYEFPTSSCRNGICSKCIIPQGDPGVSKPSLNYIYYPGTVLIAATMSIHQPGEDAVSCGDVNGLEGFQLAEAFVYILDQINGADIFPRWVTVGGVVLDDCTSSERALSELSDLEIGRLPIIGNDGLPVDQKSVLAYVSGYNDPILRNVARLSSELSRPLLSYRSVSSIILDTTTYKYIAEVVPDISKQVEVIVSFLKQMNWSYVQVLYSSDEYGQDALSVFRKKTSDSKICISSSHLFSEDSEMILKLRSNQQSKVIVTFMPSHHYFQLIGVLNKTGSYREFIFVTDTNWPRKSDLISKYPEETHGFITLALKDGTSAEFLSHLRKIRPSNYTRNPWIKEWYEYLNNCSFSGTIRSRFSTRCAEIPLTESKGFQLTDETVYVMNAVYSVAWGLDATFRHYCGPGYDRICASYLEAENRSEVLFENILNVWFNDDTMTAHYFTDRSGNRPVIINNINHGVAVKIAEYNFGAKSFHIRKSSIVTYLDSIVLPGCTGLCTECLYLSHVTEDVVYASGDIVLGAIFNIHQAGTGSFDCADAVSGAAVQFVEALHYALNEVNMGRAPVKLNGIQLGAVVFDGCHSEIRSAGIISNVHFGLLDINKGKDKLDIDSIVSWITEEGTYTHAVTQKLGLTHALLEGSGDIDNGLISMVPRYPSEHLTKLLFKVLREMNITNINVISASSKGLLELIKETAARDGICVSNVLLYTDSASPGELIWRVRSAPSRVAVLHLNESSSVKLLRARQHSGIISDVFIILIPMENDDVRNIPNYLLRETLILEQSGVRFAEFDEFVDKQTIPSNFSPWLMNYYEQLYGCKLARGYSYNETCKILSPLTSSELYKQSRRTTDVMNYVFLMTSALHRALLKRCGRNYSGVCNRLSNPSVLRKEIQTQLPLVSFKDIKGRIQHLDKDGVLVPEYTVTLYDKRGEVKTRLSRNNVLSPAAGGSWDEMALAYGCQFYCDECSNSSVSREYQSQDGDIVIGGLFNIHAQKDGFSCSSINRNHGFQLAEAFQFAIQYVNQKKGIFADKLKGVNLGSLSFDVCQSPFKATKLLSDAFFGSLKQADADLREKLVAVVGPFTTDVFVEASMLLDRLDIPHISYGIAGVELVKYKSSRRLGAVPSLEASIEAVVAVLKTLNLQYVQVVYSESTYGRSALASFQNLSRISNICIAQNVLFRAPIDAIVDRLLTKYKARMIVVLLDPSDMRPFVRTLEKSTTATRTFNLIASQTWANDDELLQELGGFVLNTVTVGVESANVKEFDEYLATQTLQKNSANPWFKEYYETVFGCKLPSAASVQHTCTTPYKDIAGYSGYKQDTYAVHTINSVFAIALSIHETLNDLCGKNNGLCQRFWDEKDRYIAMKLNQTTFKDLTGKSFTFLKDGFSNKGFNIYRVSSINGHLYYRKIGSYNSEKGLNMPVFELGWNTTCDNQCHECDDTVSSGTGYASVITPDSSNIMAFIPVHKASDENSAVCGEIDYKYGFYNMLAFFYAVHRINKDRDFSLPRTIKLGGTVVDTCENRFRIAENILALLSKGKENSAEFERRKNYVGFIAMNNDDLDMMREMTKTVPSVIVSPSLMPPDCSVDESFVLRTKSSEEKEGRVMAEIARRMSWVYVAVIISRDFGEGAARAFLNAAVASRNQSGICVGLSYTMPHQSTYADALDPVDAAQKMAGINVFVLFTKPADTRFLLRAVADLQLSARFAFLGGTSWGDNIEVSSGLGQVAGGSVVLQSRAEIVAGFDSYVESLNLNDHGAIPREWFEEFWQRANECMLENATKPLVQFATKCSPNGRLTSANRMQNSNVLYTLIATQIFAIGLSRVDECARHPSGFATCFSSLSNGAQRLYESTKTALWRSQPGLLYGNNVLDFQFKDGFGNLGFSIGSIYDDGTFFGIGYYYDESLRLDIKRYESGLRFVKAKRTLKTSQCPHNKLCTCEQQTGQNGTVVRMVRNANNTDRLLAVAYYSNFSTSWGLAFVVLSGAGIAIALVLFIYLLVAYPDRGGTSVLGFLLLFAVILTYAINFAFLLHPDRIICDVRKFGQGFVYALAFGCMLLKVMVIWQQEDEESAPVYRRLKNPTSMFFIAFALSLVQAALAVEWIVLAPSDSEMVYLSGNRAFSICTPLSMHYQELAMSCIYVIILMVLTLVFASMTYYSEENCRESRWILAVTILNTVVWIFWIALTCTMDYAVRDSIIIIANLVNASITLIFVFIRKLYLLTKFVREDKQESKLPREIAFLKTSEMTDKDNFHEPVMTFVCPVREYSTAESVHSGKTSERFYFGAQEKWDTAM